MATQNYLICRQFRYSREELDAIVECLGPSEWSSTPLNWRENNTHQYVFDYEEPLGSDLGLREFVICGHAIQCLAKKFSRDWEQDRRDEMKRYERLFEVLKNLDREIEGGASSLDFPNTFQQVNEINNKLEIPDIKELQKQIKLLIANYENSASVYNNLMSSAPSTEKQPHVTSFVLELCAFWENWTGKRAGASKVNGPAARFVMRCIRPVEVFAKKRFGKKLRYRAKDLVSESGAGNLIYDARIIRRRNWVDSHS